MRIDMCSLVRKQKNGFKFHVVYDSLGDPITMTNRNSASHKI